MNHIATTTTKKSTKCLNGWQSILKSKLSLEVVLREFFLKEKKKLIWYKQTIFWNIFNRHACLYWTQSKTLSILLKQVSYRVSLFYKYKERKRKIERERQI